MIRRSARLDKNNSRNHITIALQNIIDSVHFGNGKKYRIKKIIEVVEYTIDNFDKIKQTPAFRDVQKFENFAKVFYNKIQGFVEEGEQILQQGEKIKMSVEKLKRYQCIYENLYVEYQDKRFLERRTETMTTLIDKKKEIAQGRVQQMRKHIKKFLINQIPLCEDVLEIVKSYCFYDKKTIEQIKFVKGVKQHIVTLFDFAIYSRKNGYMDYHDTDVVEHWLFCIDRDEVEFQGINCKRCGNYFRVTSESWVPHNIICSC
jgi:hypothetical protein